MIKQLNTNRKLVTEAERFAYQVSHDLSAPARHIRQFTELLCQRLDDRLEPKDLELAEIIKNSALQMEQMISALLLYSRICSSDSDRNVLDLNMVVHSVQARFSKRLEWSNAVVNVSKLPAVEADWEQISYVFEQLFDNALAFRSTASHPIIEITGGVLGDMVEVQFHDNGIGIPYELAERVFEFFYRLDPQNNDGLGVGLPTCRKFLEMHGGRMWVEPCAHGTSVRFVLPALGH